MKRILVLLFVCVLALSSEAAINKAEMRVAYTAKTAGKVDFTVFNNTNGKGFIILDNQDQVLGYSDQCSFDYEN